MAALDTLRGAFAGISSRERRLLVGLGTAIVLLAVGVAYYLAATAIDDIETDRAAISEALRTIRDERVRIRQRADRRRAVAARYETRAPALTSFVENAATGTGVTVSEATDRTTPPPEGKRFQKRTVSIRLRRVDLQSLVRFMDRIEAASFPVAITSIRVRKRFGESNSYDVDDMVISTWDRLERPTPRRGAGGSPREGSGASAGGSANAQELR